ncbi:MAG TPA: isoprenyl transferase [Balneolales bacterium]|nr:isoprenyl transferase [Balneolales bacterium]
MKAISLKKDSQTEEDRIKQSQLKASGEIPVHIAIIMDGNGRWAKDKGNLRIYGHKVGVDSVRDITEACAQLGVKYLTLYAFSTENWNRPSTEVSALMQILIQSLRKEARRLNKNDIKLTAIGQIDRFPKICQRELDEAMDMTKDNKRMQLCLALSYSGRWDITQAVQKIASKVKKGEVLPEDISDDLIGSLLSTGGEPDPDLIIRTSGEYRISNFLLWQLAYSELYITQTCWPDFRRNELYNAITSFQKRERRYGKISEQVRNNGSHLGL